MKQRERRKKNRSKRVLDPSTMARACGAVTWDEKQGGKQGWRQSTGRRDRQRDLPAHFTWTSVRPDRVTVRERERDSETDTYRQPQDRKTERETQDMQTSTRDRETHELFVVRLKYLHEKIFIKVFM